MPNRRGRTGANAKRPSSCSPVSRSRRGGGACGRGFPAVAMFDLLSTDVITPECWSPGFAVRYLYPNKQRPEAALTGYRIEIARKSRKATGGEWIEMGAWK